MSIFVQFKIMTIVRSLYTIFHRVYSFFLDFNSTLFTSVCLFVCLFFFSFFFVKRCENVNKQRENAHLSVPKVRPHKFVFILSVTPTMSSKYYRFLFLFIFGKRKNLFQFFLVQTIHDPICQRINIFKDIDTTKRIAKNGIE